MKKILLIVAVLCGSITFSACAKKASAPMAAAPAKHEHHPPHGGTPVALGDEVYHLEFVLDAATGKLSAFVLDGELENFIRVNALSFEVIATIDGAKRPLLFSAVADSATGETVGDTALFVASAEWLKSTREFDAALTKLEVRGTTFSDVAFNFPQGNEKP